MANPACWILPGLCSNGQVAGEGSWLGDLLSLFDSDAAGDTLRSALETVQSTRQFDLGLVSFVTTYQQLFGLMLILSVLLFSWTLLRLAISNSNGEESVAGLLAPFKIFVFGSFLLVAGSFIRYLGELATWIAKQFLREQNWVDDVTRGFSFGGFWVRIIGKVLSGLLRLEIVPLELWVPLFILMGLITYSLTAFRSNYVMGKPSRWMWALLLTALTLKPALTLYFGIGGGLIMNSDAPEGDKSVMVLALLATSLFLWMFVFMAFNKRIQAYVDNRVQVRGDVRNRPSGTGRQQVEVNRTFNARQSNINRSAQGKHGLRSARHATTDASLGALAKKAASSGHPAVGTTVVIVHAFFKGRRKKSP